MFSIGNILQRDRKPTSATKLLCSFYFSFCGAMRCISAAYTVMRCLCVCVCLSVTFVSCCVKTNKDIFEIFSPSGTHTILVFFIPSGMAIFRREPPNGGVKCRWGRQKSRFWAYMPAVDDATGEVLSTCSPVDYGHHLASCDNYIAGRILRVFDYQAPMWLFFTVHVPVIMTVLRGE